MLTFQNLLFLHEIGCNLAIIAGETVHCEEVPKGGLARSLTGAILQIRDDSEPMSVSPQAVDTTTSEALDSPYSRL